MKTIYTHFRTRSKNILPKQKSSVLITLVFASFLFTSCVEYGYNGRPGDSFLSLTWSTAQPDYLDAGTMDIPSIFEWGAYYHTYPGSYTIYYDGSYWNGYRHARYAWEMDYSIYTIAGEPAGPYYNGADGPNTYFTIDCSPFGPELYTDTRYKKDAITVDKNMDEHIINVPDTINYTKNNYRIRIIYKRVVPRNNS